MEGTKLTNWPGEGGNQTTQRYYHKLWMIP